MKVVTKTVEIGGKTIKFETGKYAKQASGAVVVSCGDSMVLVTAVCAAGDRPFDFLPLTVDYQDRNGASGTIPGGYLKREGRQSERETLISRLIDRPLRPMFPKTFRMELQCIATAMSYDRDHETDVLALCGASAAFHISEAPLSQAIAGVRVCRVDGKLVLNPTFDERQRADVNLVIAGTSTALTMVEGGANEVEEAVMLDCFDLAQEAIRSIIATLDAFKAAVGKEQLAAPPAHEIDAKVVSYFNRYGKKKLTTALAIKGKHERSDALKAARDELIEKMLAKDEDAESVAAKTADAKLYWEKLHKSVMREQVIEEGRRIDGRATDEIRDIWVELGVAPRAHGSAIFCRGETQGFVTVALGTELDAQRIENPWGKEERSWMLTYNFPPFCTGEARAMRGPKRREIGHGALAHRALIPVLPSQQEFPYVLRSTSEILESNGSSSMATVCGSSLALMDAGVPVKAAVAGIAMGLIKEGEKFAVLSDILGDEDHLGDMDFKVTGTTKGITAFQMDVKIDGINRQIMAKALEQARQGRVHILGEMAKGISAPRKEMSRFAPRITTIHIKQDKIRDLIGPGGKVIRGIQEACDVRIKVEDSGRVDVASTSTEATDKALQMIREITQEAEVGAVYVAFVEIFPGTDGLIHISHLAHERVDKVTDVLHEGDEVLVRVLEVDRSGKIRLSRKEALDAMGA